MAVLKLLQRRQMYGYELVEAVAQRSEGALAMGQSTLYPMLYNLEAKGLIAATWHETPGGRDRKYYHLTQRGEAELADKTAQWQALTRAMQALGVLNGGGGAREVTA